MVKFTIPKIEEESLPAADVLMAFMQRGMREEEAEALFAQGLVYAGKWRRKRIAGDTALKPGASLFVKEKRPLEEFLVRGLSAPVYEDESLLIFNKPTGLQTSTDKNQAPPTLYTGAVNYMEQVGEYDVDTLRVPYICYRLPVDMGGLVVVAKSQWPFENLLAALKERRIKRYLYAVVSGEVEARAQLNSFVVQDKKKGVQVSTKASRGARPCAIRYRSVEMLDDLTLLEIELITPQSSQVKAQLAAHKLFVLGDTEHGSKKINKKYAVYRSALWAHKLIFETGRNNPLEYLSGREVLADYMLLPPIGFSYDAL